jgi:hypothetical protein
MHAALLAGMRSLASCVVLGLLTAPALAAPGVSQSPAVNLAPIVLADLPEPCRPIAKQAAAPLLASALAARIRVAGCIADQATAKLDLCDCGASILELATAIEPAVALLDEVIAAGDPTARILAAHAKGELYTSLRVRMLATIPTGDATTEGAALRDSRKAMLEPQLAPWADEANTAFARVVELAKANPKLLANPVVRTAVDTSKQRLALKVAKVDQGTSAP